MLQHMCIYVYSVGVGMQWSLARKISQVQETFLSQYITVTPTDMQSVCNRASKVFEKIVMFVCMWMVLRPGLALTMQSLQNSSGQTLLYSNLSQFLYQIVSAFMVRIRNSQMCTLRNVKQLSLTPLNCPFVSRTCSGIQAKFSTMQVSKN